jgi:hypothetical protein
MKKEYYVIKGPHTIVNNCGIKAFKIPEGKFAVAYLGNDNDGNLDMISHFGVCFQSETMADRAAKKLGVKAASEPPPERKEAKIVGKDRMLRYYCHSCSFHTMVNTKFVEKIERIRSCVKCNKPIMVQ